VTDLAWEDHLAPGGTLAVDAVGRGAGIHHTHYAAQRVKDAIVDRFRARTGRRPSVSLARPDLRVHLRLEERRATVSIDLSGEALHRRGYRVAPVEAPVKENLAAGVLLRAGWPAVAARGGGLVDPMCGSGTLPIEAALLAGDVAPGLGRGYWGFLGWQGHDPGAWAALLAEARARARAGLARLPTVAGYDLDAGAVAAARDNARAAGLAGRLRLERRPVAELAPPAPDAPPGLVVVNPPYGERLGDRDALRALYATLGERLRTAFPGWQAAVLATDPALAGALGLQPARSHTLWNGPIETRLLRFVIPGVVTRSTTDAPPAPPPAAPGRGESARAPVVPPALPAPRSPGAEMLANRLRKNLSTLGRWARREAIDCYRLYDADMPEYAVAVDLYRGEALWVHVQEYAPPAGIDPAAARRRLAEAMAVIPEVLEVPRSHLYLKVRRRQRPETQYGRLAGGGPLREVREDGCRFLVNLSDYLDTGLFLDHRETRRLLARLAPGARFLSLFAYTGTATVCVARAGGESTTSVDLSRTYLDWARRNLALNGIEGPAHTLIEADCLAWLEAEAQAGPHRPRYDLIFLDPPTFSNSKRMREDLDVQRDHPRLVRLAAELLAPGGTLLFTTHLRRFRLDREALAGLALEDVTRATIPKDFARNPRMHQAWLVRSPEAKAGGCRAEP
jgi:23S rRNA (guanine2445-N2)-methyltransferase / 23S rRNA (guanine2069-N7)-methyltransferase